MTHHFRQEPYSFQEKVHNFHKEIARKQRQQIFAKKRQELIISQQELPLQSSILEKFWNVTSRQINLCLDQINDVLDNINPTQLSQQEHNEMCHDLLYLLVTYEDFSLPYTFEFKKDGSPYTAVVACYSLWSLSDQEINYWMTYMDDETKDILYLQLLAHEIDYDRWVKNLNFLEETIKDWGYREDAEVVIIRLLQNIQMNSDEEDFCFYQSLWERIFEMNKQRSINFTPSMFIIIGMLINFYMTDSYQPKNKKLDYLRVIFNQGLIAIHQKNITYDMGLEFTRICNFLTNKSHEYNIHIFVREGFNAMCEILVKNFHEKFIDKQSPKYLKNTMKEEDVNKIRSQFIADLIIICLNHLRINGLNKIKEQIPQNLIEIFNLHKEPTHQPDLQRLFNINSFIIEQCYKKAQKQSQLFNQKDLNDPLEDYQI